MRILFVCLGNICRSPAGEGVLRARAEDRGLALQIDSAGTGGWHAGDPPDPRMIAAAARRGYDLSPQRARQVTDADHYDWDLLIAMDRSVANTLAGQAPGDATADIRLCLDFTADRRGEDVPDPYYGGAAGFDHVLDLIEAAADGLLATLAR